MNNKNNRSIPESDTLVATFRRAIRRPVLYSALLLALSLGIGTGARAAADPGAPGPLQVSSGTYGGYGQTVQFPGFPGPVEMFGKVFWPSALNNKYPLVLFLHGRHAVCYSGNQSRNEFPCSPGWQNLPNYLGYDCLAQSLASHGYIVVSVSANGINAKDDDATVTDRGALARAQLLQMHLGLWQQANAGQIFSGLFKDRVNLSFVGTMGHSRGGEGVVRHYLYNTEQGKPYNIRAVFPLAPVDFNRYRVNGTALGVLLPYCDGDVSNLAGVHYYDDSRYNVASDSGAKHTFLVLGANHNFYNTVWTPGLFQAGGSDDWLNNPGSGGDPHCGTVGVGRRLTDAQQRGTALAYVKAFFRRYLGGVTVFADYLDGKLAPPPSAQTQSIHVAFHPAAAQRLNVNRMVNRAALNQNDQGGAVLQARLAQYRFCGIGNTRCLPTTQAVAREPHFYGLEQTKLAWIWTNPVGAYFNEIPATFGDVSGYKYLQFRAGVDFSDARNPAQTSQNFTVYLIDSSNRITAPVNVDDYTRSLFFPPGAVGPVPHVILNRVAVPLAVFGGIDLRALYAVEFDFDRNSSGAIFVSDIMFTR